VHSRIGDHYEASTGRCSDTQIIRLVMGVCRCGGSSGSATAWIATRSGESVPGKGDIYEIKPDQFRGRCRSPTDFLFDLLKTAGLASGGPKWHLGTAAEYTPPTVIPINSVAQAMSRRRYSGLSSTTSRHR